MSEPVNPSTEKVEQSFLPISLKPSSARFPISYADAIWDIANIGSTLSALTQGTGQFDQHTINELFAQLIVSIQQTLELIWREIGGDEPIPTGDFSSDFSSDFS